MKSINLMLMFVWLFKVSLLLYFHHNVPKNKSNAQWRRFFIAFQWKSLTTCNGDDVLHSYFQYISCFLLGGGGKDRE